MGKDSRFLFPVEMNIKPFEDYATVFSLFLRLFAQDIPYGELSGKQFGSGDRRTGFRELMR